MLDAPAKEDTPLVAKKAAAKPLLSAIEGCRTLFTVGIIIYHYSGVRENYVRFHWQEYQNAGNATAPTEFEEWFSTAFLNGSAYAGVTVFFVIAGFLSQLSNALPPTGVRDRLKFICQRFLRLAPAYYFAIFLMAIFSVWNEDLRLMPSDYYTNLPMELLMIQRWVINDLSPAPDNCGRFYNGIAWFVSALFGHICLQSLFGTWFSRATPGAWSALVGAIVCCAGRMAIWWLNSFDDTHPYTTDTRHWYYYWTIATFPAYLAGYCTARLVNHLEPDGPIRSWRGWAVVDSLSFVLFMLGYLVRLPGTEWQSIGGAHGPPEGLFASQIAVPLFCLLCFQCCCTHQGIVLKILGFPAFASLGPYSYAAYLLQIFWLKIALAILSDPVHLAFPVFVLMTCWGSAAAVHHLIEKPLAPRLKTCVDACFAPPPEGGGAHAPAPQP